jgi:hypothetical protein
MLIDAIVKCLACGGEHEIVSWQTYAGQQYDLCPFCNDVLPHRILCGGGFSASDFESDLGIDLETSPPPLD